MFNRNKCQWDVPETQATCLKYSWICTKKNHLSLLHMTMFFQMTWPRLAKDFSWFSVPFHRAGPLRITATVIWESKCPRNKACAAGKVWPERGRHYAAEDTLDRLLSAQHGALTQYPGSLAHLSLYKGSLLFLCVSAITRVLSISSIYLMKPIGKVKSNTV